ncbi:SGNH/GDSL hydrolase family protein [Streptomyces sp. NBC_00454]|uniref:SGNH/GDSL hydrolase family protein n=1 Tax=Streptomyces sp. NBC_00454 TaxID=2975747 RepID=UPI0030E0BC07
MSIRTELAPYLTGYEEKFTSKGEIRWLPHLLYFHPQSYTSEVVNTDSVGFRYATDGDRSYSVADHGTADSVRLLAGSSTVFGIGASSDAWTLPSRLNVHDEREQTWLNFGGRSFNSTQELLLLTLYRHLLPKVDEIVLFSGFNNLSLARMPQVRNEDHGTFFQYNMYNEKFTAPSESKSGSSVFNLLRKKQESAAPAAPVPPSISEQIEYAAELTLRHLDAWKALASTWDAKITYILQPLSGWVRDKGSKEEELIFDELERLGGFAAMYGDILSKDVNIEYAARLEQGAKDLGINFVNFSPIMAESAEADQWLFIDRIHLTDNGHDFVARKILENI